MFILCLFVSAYMCTTCVWYPYRPEGVIRSLELKLQETVNHDLKPNPGLLQDHQVPLTPEAFLQPCFFCQDEHSAHSAFCHISLAMQTLYFPDPSPYKWKWEDETFPGQELGLCEVGIKQWKTGEWKGSGIWIVFFSHHRHFKTYLSLGNL